MYGKLPVTGATLTVATGLAISGFTLVAIGVALVVISAVGVRRLWRRGQSVTTS